MAELTTSERLQPALLDRLIDDEPGARVENRERRVLSMRQLRTAVLRDLTYLLNAPAKPRQDEMYAFPLVARSVVNFGVPDMTGLTVSGVRPEQIEQMLNEAIAAFEPRIVRRSLNIKATEAEEAGGTHIISFEIAGDLCPLPMPEALFMRTVFDLETGQCMVKDSGHG